MIADVPPIALGLVALLALAVLAAALLAAAGARRVKARYRELLEAVQVVQRQLSELRGRQDELTTRVAAIDERLAQRLEPAVERLARGRLAAETAAAVERAAAAGRLSAETAARLSGALAELAEEAAADGRPE